MSATDSLAHVNTPAERDVLRFIVAVLEVRDDEDAVKNVIDEHLALINPHHHAILLKVVMRVMVAQFYAPTANMVDEGWTEVRLGRQRALNSRAAMREEAGSVRYPFFNPERGEPAPDPKVIRP